MTNKERDEVAFHTWHHLPTQDLETWEAACAYKESENKELWAMLERLEWSQDASEECPHCDALRDFGHEKDCKLSELLKRKPV